MSPPTAEERGGTTQTGRRWMPIALVVSLAINLLVLGLVAGVGWKRWHDEGREERGHPFSRGVERLIDRMPPERRRAAQAIFERYKADVRPLWREVGEARRRTIEAMEAEPFDPVRVQKSMEALRRAQAEAGDKFSAIMLELMPQLTAEERRELLRNFRRRDRDRPIRPQRAEGGS